MSTNLLKLLTPVYFLFFSVYPYLHVHVGCHHGIEVCAHVEMDDHQYDDPIERHDHGESHIHFRGDWSHLHASKSSFDTTGFVDPLPDYAPILSPASRYCLESTPMFVFLTLYTPALRRAPPDLI